MNLGGKKLIEGTNKLNNMNNKNNMIIRNIKSGSNTERIHDKGYFYKHRAEFNPNFESGNLFRVYQKEHNEYDLIIQNDINTKGNNQWFFFSTRNISKGSVVKFNLLNFTKSNSLFDYGMKPAVFSMMRF
eukprot:GHVR01124301.1.p1 GENE.GHVR01124301.1~~GHVR01124301.1.p1  ORF type:complete len:130 (+),score=1.95 GHVR01124301.1:677-1066(+)